MSNVTEKAPRNHNTLSHKDFYTVARWVESNHESLKNMTHIKAAEVVSTALGFPVTANNISAVTATLGITIGRVFKKPADPKETNKTLAQAIVSLCEALGQTVTAPLRAIAES